MPTPFFRNRFSKKLPIALILTCFALNAQTNTATTPVNNSKLNSKLFYQLLIAELELGNGQVGISYSLMLDAARKNPSDELFKRAVQIAVQVQAGNDALIAAQAWRKALPESIEAVRADLQILLALNRLESMGESLTALIELTPEAQRSDLILSVPHLFERSPNPAQAREFVENLLAPFAKRPNTQTATQLAMARMYLQEGKTRLTLRIVSEVLDKNPASAPAATLAAELLRHEIQAENLVKAYLNQAQPDATVQLAYVQQLISTHRSREAIERARSLTRQSPELSQAWWLLGMELFDLNHRAEGQTALLTYLEKEPTSATPQTALQASALLALAKMAIVQSQFDAANAYLKRITLPEKALDVQFHAALILAHQGNMTAARQLIQSVTASTPELVIQTQLAEARLLRQFDRDKEALQVLQECNQKFPDTPEVLYEMAMTQEGLGQYESMEKNLRTLIGLRPNHAHAHNALGYSLADRGIRLNEALELVERALELMPNEPFITDSLGWVHFKMGHTATAIDVLRKAYAYRPDVEIATHLAEVLWVQGQTQEAIELWQQAQQLDKTHTTLLKTLKRLGVSW